MRLGRASLLLQSTVQRTSVSRFLPRCQLTKPRGFLSPNSFGSMAFHRIVAISLKLMIEIAIHIFADPDTGPSSAFHSITYDLGHSLCCRCRQPRSFDDLCGHNKHTLTPNCCTRNKPQVPPISAQLSITYRSTSNLLLRWQR